VETERGTLPRAHVWSRNAGQKVCAPSRGWNGQAKSDGGRIVALAFAYNTLGIAAAVTGHLHPVLAATLMLASSLSVTTLAARAGASGTIHYLP
jgi:hypothetical protein